MQKGRITFVDHIRNLGITIDKQLLFISNVKKASEKAKNVFFGLARTVKLKYGVKPQQYMKLYRTVFQSMITYGEEMWGHTVTHSHIKRALISAQAKALKDSTGAYSTVPNLTMNIVHGFLPLDLQVSENLKLKNLKLGLITTTREEIVRETNAKWQEEWDNTSVGRYTHDLLPLARRGKDIMIEGDHLSMEVYSNHGASRQCLNRFGKLDSPFCDWCLNEEEFLYHAIFVCPKFQLTRKD